MNTDTGLYRLMTWLSPSYPVGAYAFSHGLEYAVESGAIMDRESAYGWIRALVLEGGGRADLVFLKEAWQSWGDPGRMAELSRYAVAYQATSELRTESLAQGRAFADVTSDAWPHCKLIEVLTAIGSDTAYPVVVGAVAGIHDIERDSAMTAYGHAFAANLVSAALRLVPLGQTEGQACLLQLIPELTQTAEHSVALADDELWVSGWGSAIASMQHETLYTRLFRS